MGYFKRKKSKTYNAGTRMIIPGLGILTANIQNGDKLRIKPNQPLNNVFPPPTPTPSNTPPPSATPANTPTPTPTPSNTPTNVYYITVFGLNQTPLNELILIYKSTNSGLTWTSLSYMAPGNVTPSQGGGYSGSGIGNFNSGSTVWIGIQNTSYNNIIYGSGLFSGDFNSLCGLSEPFKINSLSANTNVYLNFATINDNAYITC